MYLLNVCITMHHHPPRHSLVLSHHFFLASCALVAWRMEANNITQQWPVTGNLRLSSCTCTPMRHWTCNFRKLFGHQLQAPHQSLLFLLKKCGTASGAENCTMAMRHWLYVLSDATSMFSIVMIMTNPNPMLCSLYDGRLAWLNFLKLSHVRHHYIIMLQTFWPCKHHVTVLLAHHPKAM